MNVECGINASGPLEPSVKSLKIVETWCDVGRGSQKEGGEGLDFCSRLIIEQNARWSKVLDDVSCVQV